MNPKIINQLNQEDHPPAFTHTGKGSKLPEPPGLVHEPPPLFEAFPSGQGGKDFVREFLFGRTGLDVEGQRIRAGIDMDLRTEGWVDIPHGGIGMGAVMDMALLLDRKDADSRPLYPLTVDYRMGGASIRTGSRVLLDVAPSDSGVSGCITAAEGTPPYLSAEIAFGRDDLQKKEAFLSYLPPNASALENRFTPLPSYQNCFVCGMDRQHPGLERSFHLLDKDAPAKIVLSTIGHDPSDQQNVYLFQRDDRLHPLVLIALLDETLGWAGFMATAGGGVTVRISYTFYRNISVGERLVAFGRAEKVRGKNTSRQFFWSSGGAAVMGEDGRMEVVAAAFGQWLCMPALTEQMWRELRPIHLKHDAFTIASS